MHTSLSLCGLFFKIGTTGVCVGTCWRFEHIFVQQWDENTGGTLRLCVTLREVYDQHEVYKWCVLELHWNVDKHFVK